MLGVLLLCIGGFVFAYGGITKRKTISLFVAALMISTFIFYPGVSEAIAELAPKIYDPLKSQ
jgi:hypothetical protein